MLPSLSVASFYLRFQEKVVFFLDFVASYSTAATTIPKRSVVGPTQMISLGCRNE